MKSEDQMNYAMCKVISKMPIGNQAILKSLFSFLKIVEIYQDINKMNSLNLAIVFAPTLFR